MEASSIASDLEPGAIPVAAPGVRAAKATAMHRILFASLAGLVAVTALPSPAFAHGGPFTNPGGAVPPASCRPATHRPAAPGPSPRRPEPGPTPGGPTPTPRRPRGP
jgi:hypothetical protein